MKYTLLLAYKYLLLENLIGWIFPQAGKSKIILESRYSNNKGNSTTPLGTKEWTLWVLSIQSKTRCLPESAVAQCPEQHTGSRANSFNPFSTLSYQSLKKMIKKWENLNASQAALYPYSQYKFNLDQLHLIIASLLWSIFSFSLYSAPKSCLFPLFFHKINNKMDKR